MNHNYRSEEFRFYLEDTAARLLICPPTGAEEARKPRAIACRYFRRHRTPVARCIWKVRRKGPQ